MRQMALRFLGLALLMGAISGCEEIGLKSSLVPQARPANLQTGPKVTEPSAESRALARHYQRIQDDLLTRGLLRRDGGGPDTPFSADDLARNFETIAFFDEYSRGGVDSAEGALSRWVAPVRIGVEFGASVPLDQRAQDMEAVTAYAARLGRVTGHPIAPVENLENKANFHVFIAGKDDGAFVQNRLKQLVPQISATELALFRDVPRSFYCLVVSVSDRNSARGYTRAVALIRAEHPDLMRLSCIHEELAQGLGLPNDSPQARPSIFNDDDEFALLTSHDELLLQLLYDPRLTPGMTAAQARPVTRIIARELMGQTL